MKQALAQFLGRGDAAAQARRQVLPVAIMFGVFLALCVLSVWVPTGAATWLLSALALAAIWLTAVARVNDINKPGRRWHVRRVALVLTGCGAIARILDGLGTPPTWGEVVLEIGVALTWMTTPGMPPWLYFIFGERREESP